jgi:peptide/nickel transport system substrate-binding protein
MITRRIAVAALCSIFTLPAIAQSTTSPRYGGTLIAVLPDDPPTLATWLSSSFLPRMVAPQIVEGLVEFDPSLKAHPLLAESWEVSPDAKQYTFHLRKNVRFHDGKPFTADDVIFSVEEVWLKHQSEFRTRWTGVGLKVEKRDDHTVVFKLERPYVYALNYLSSHFGPILPKHLYEGTDIPNNPYNLKPVGTGPFKFQEYVKGSHVALVRNAEYWAADSAGGKLPYLDRIVMRIIPDPTARTLAMSKGEVDYQNYPGFPVESVSSLRKLGYQIGAEPVPGAARIQRVFLNQRTGPLADVRVRKALFHALDRQSIIDRAAYGFGVVSKGPLHQKSEAYADLLARDLPTYEYNVQKANALLDEAGFKKDASGARFKLDFVINRSLSIDGAVADLMRDYFKAVGIDLNIRKVDEATRLAAAANRQFDMTMLGGTISGPTPEGVSYYWLSSLKDSKSGWDNIAGINDPQIDDLLSRGGSTMDTAERNKIWKTFQHKMVDEARELWLFDVLIVSAWNKNFHGLPQRTWGHYDAHTKTWWDKGRRT